MDWQAEPLPEQQPLTRELMEQTWKRLAEQPPRPEGPIIVNFERYQRTLAHNIPRRMCLRCGKDAMEILYMKDGELCKANA